MSKPVRVEVNLTVGSTKITNVRNLSDHSIASWKDTPRAYVLMTLGQMVEEMLPLALAEMED